MVALAKATQIYLEVFVKLSSVTDLDFHSLYAVIRVNVSSYAMGGEYPWLYLPHSTSLEPKLQSYPTLWGPPTSKHSNVPAKSAGGSGQSSSIQAHSLQGAIFVFYKKCCETQLTNTKQNCRFKPIYIKGKKYGFFVSMWKTCFLSAFPLLRVFYGNATYNILTLLSQFQSNIHRYRLHHSPFLLLVEA